MRLLLLLSTLWISSLALKCVNGTVIDRGKMVTRKEQEALISRAGNNTKICYFVLEDCSNGSFEVTGEAYAPIPVPKGNLLNCWQTNGTVVCGCDDEDYCNIRLYYLYDLLHSDERVLNGPTEAETIRCFRKLLHDILPHLTPATDLSSKYPVKEELAWWWYVIFVILGTNVIGVAFYLGDLINNCVKRRKATKEEARLKKSAKEAKAKNRSAQYHYLWPLKDMEQLKPKVPQSGETPSEQRTQRDEP